MTIPLNPMPQSNRLYSNITPFTVRDNATYQIVLEELRAFINLKLVPFVNENVGSLDEAWVAQTQELIDAWNAQSEALIAQVNSAVTGIGTAVEDAQTAQAAAETARDLAAQFASQVQEIQDTAITAIFADFDSEFRKAFNDIVSEFLLEDPEDEGTFIINVPTAPEPPEPSAVQPDPNDPGFFV